MPESDSGYVDYLEILGLPPDFKPADVRRNYRKKIKDLLAEITGQVMTEDRRNQYLLQIAQLNAAFYILRDNDLAAKYLADREEVMSLEEAWQQAAGDASAADGGRRQFDQALRHFLSTYLEEIMLQAGRDAECVENSGWDPAHERHASSVLRHYRQRLYHKIHERLPYYDVTRPEVDWAERANFVRAMLRGGDA
ncbi:MAG: hypothetical protein GXY15_10370 [Candidatus Hydrogenedentes bacterium]|nr:hypothetical protein [Candidatus Hydrogenedentota bacterium]